MRVLSESQAGSPPKANEDWVSATRELIIVLDGATARTDTGCVHGVSWYAKNLGSAIEEFAQDADLPLKEVLRKAICRVAGLHSECDLKHPGSPSAAVAIVRLGVSLDYLVLGDVSLVICGSAGVSVVTDPRVSSTARAERAEADRHPIGSPEKEAALLRMKAGELAAKNHEGGYWIAASEPSGVDHALTGAVDPASVRDLAVFTDGAARIVDLFSESSWADVLTELREAGRPVEIIGRVRSLEDSDARGERWPRNKKSDDATIVYADLRLG
ncbi:protein phosphatase 2C domain-containing protein [Streptomyces sp. B1866]|uniref:protein phosphatase 2C domain-containing protein n=1 Tax=Streptomyces sp. B1866 TaxID=3075431 RepID=UPI0028924705|nr:protein phosphatase 2C domain-containing protein [Streptomyces sp. B1866]MDT3400656.1 protein phosphatase 2C domain-containing protein [Streptomyces sp. B1866]